jgi:hypothetical protein
MREMNGCSMRDDDIQKKVVVGDVKVLLLGIDTPTIYIDNIVINLFDFCYIVIVPSFIHLPRLPPTHTSSSNETDLLDDYDYSNSTIRKAKHPRSEN